MLRRWIVRFLFWYDQYERHLLNSIVEHADAPYDQRVWRAFGFELWEDDLYQAGYQVRWNRLPGERRLRRPGEPSRRVIQVTLRNPAGETVTLKAYAEMLELVLNQPEQLSTLDRCLQDEINLLRR